MTRKPFAMRGSTDAPCKDCPDRSPTCHATCEDYNAWKSWRDGKINPQKEHMITVNDYLHDSWRAVRRYEFMRKKGGRT